MYRLTIILLLSVPPLAFGRTLTEADLSGVWVDAWQRFADQIDPPDRLPVRNVLVIDADLSITLTRQFDSGSRQVLVAREDDVAFLDDLLIAEFSHEDVRFKLVVSGWSISDESLLFGHLYLYDQEGLFNGIPVGFEPSDDAEDPVRG